MTTTLFMLKQRHEDNDKGATLVEYALLVGLIALAVIVGVTAFGNQVNTFFNGLAAKLGIVAG
ncbi:Flp family type IVb pilin [Raineyella fluvialis]|uniref:Flp family type IVb pilin n=2 Tax=Raineyella fluvialis TaxID=2662261 RepID=A0A5Q2FDL9_9ACTN|nr:Flp family type IVb pilin [Raineyella fluvialis]